jgi:hypothetical protein
MVAGIVLFAFATKTALAHIGHELAAVPAFALCCGPALYLLAYVALRLRVARTIGGGRLFAAAACAALTPVALAVPALAALSLVAAVWITLHAYELMLVARRTRRAASAAGDSGRNSASGCRMSVGSSGDSASTGLAGRPRSRARRGRRLGAAHCGFSLRPTTAAAAVR